MEEPHPPGSAESPQSGEMSREKLIQKCKNLLAIAQKAKIARDEAIEERAKLLGELEDAKKTITQKDQQYKNVEEIMGVLTEQKLKLAMDIDSLKKEKVTLTEHIRALNSEKETFETEAESFKRRYDRLLSENEDLIAELQLRERSESQLYNDIKKLQENNESVRVLCTNVTQEKLQLEEELGKVSAQMDLWNQTLAAKMGVDRLELKDLVGFIDRLSTHKSDEDGKGSQNPDDISHLLAASQKENETLQLQVTAMKDKIQRLMADLEVTNVDRDQMANNLEEMRVETKTLIENVEKLDEEVDTVKEEKHKVEGVLNKVIETKNEEIDNLLKELAKNKAYVQELLANVEQHMDGNKYSELNSKYLERSEELMRCKQEIEDLKKKSIEPAAVQDAAVVGSVLLILKDGIVSNLEDLADTMPEYSKEFLNKLNAMLQGTDLKGNEGADIFVHYFNECLSQLKISLKENDILSKEVDHLKNSVKELENLVSNHNKDCEQLRSELEELSSDSNRLLLDLSHLRQENSIRVTEISELMVRLKQKDEESDRLKENINRLEMEYSSQISELLTRLSDSNNNIVLLEQRNKELEGKCQSLLEEMQNESANELLELQKELDSAKMVTVALQQEMERARSALAEKTQEYENLKARDCCESSEKDLETERQQNSKLQIQIEELAKKLAENESLLSGVEELKDALMKNQDAAEKLKEELNSVCERLRCKAAELEKSQEIVEEMAAEVSSLKTKCDEKDSEIQRVVGMLGDKGSQYQESIEKLQTELKKVSEELQRTKKQLEESRSVKKEVEDLGKALKLQNSELEKAQRVLQEKASVEEELSQLKAIQQKTMEELENTKKRLDDNQSARKNASELEKSLKNKTAELEKTMWLLEERSAEKLAVSEELDKVKEELKSRVQELELSQNEGESVKHGAQEMRINLERVSRELDAARQDLRRKVELEEELVRMREALDKSVKEVEQSQEDARSAEAKAQELNEELKSLTNELENACKGLQDKKKLAEELAKLKTEYDKTAADLQTSQQLAKEGQSVKEEAQKLMSDSGRITQELEAARSELRDKEQLEIELLTLRDNLAQAMEELEKSKRLADAGETAQTEAQKLAAEVKRMSEEMERTKKNLEHNAELQRELRTANDKLQSTVDELERLLKVGEASKESLEKALVDKEAELGDALQKLSAFKEAQRQLHAEKQELVSKLCQVEQNFSVQKEGIASELKTNLEALQKEFTESKKSAEIGTKNFETLKQENAKLLETVACLQAENKVAGDKLLDQGRAFNDELKKKNEEIHKLCNEIKESKEMVSFRKMELEDINCIWAGRLNSLKVNLITLRRSLNELSRQAKELQHMFLDKLHSLNTVLTVNSESVVDLSVAEAKKELLDEMHRMNEVLKDRGEAIAKLQDTLSETEGKLESVTSQNGELVSERSKLMTNLKIKEEKLVANENAVKELEAEVGRLRDLKEGAPESDVLSTSTISRTEDHMRLKEVDDSIEEKYMKLRQIAVKLKKRVAELTQALDQSKSGPDKELQEKIQHLSAVAKNAQKVQESYDKTLDELEESKKQNVSMTAAVKELRSANESLKSQVTALQSQSATIPLMQKQIEGLNATIKELKGEINKLEMEKKVEVMKYEETKKQCTTLEAKVGNLSQSLDQAVQQGRSHNVLELEMKNYEKVIADLTSQLNSEKQKMSNSEKELESIALVKSGLEEQIALLDKQVKAEESRNANLQGQLTSMKEKMSANQRQVDEVNSQLSEVKKEMHHAKSLTEQQALEMSSLTSEFSRKELDLQSKIESFTAHIQSLETSLATTRQELSTSNSEKEHLREEFDNYRLRAQSMLARQKGDTVSQGEKEAREHLDKLKKELDGAREKMENTQTEIETLNNKLSSLQLEKARSDKRYEDITKALHQKITDYDTLNTEYRAFKFSAETLLQNTKLEFEERERALNDELSRLKDLVDALNEQAVLKSQGVDDVRVINDNAVPFEGHHLPDNLPSLQEREDGEGSESVPPPMSNFRRLSNLVPLDILLNNPIDDENRIPVLQEQIEKLHSELNSYEVRVKHLASLLSEAEKDSARSSQQNAVLKEELRRLERSLQREPHIANSEYLKNVIFKFLVLQSGDERTRLVPVLDTILKLSPEETSRLNAVARGESASWGSYLHSWTGL